MKENNLERELKSGNVRRAISAASRPTFFGYDAYFITREEIEMVRKQIGAEAKELDRAPDTYHVTLQFYGKSEPSAEEKEEQKRLRGSVKEFVVIGYGNDGKNEGLLCEGTQENGTPYHVTLSFSSDSKPVNTGRMKFERLDKPIRVNGVFYNSLDKVVKTEKYCTRENKNREAR